MHDLLVIGGGINGAGIARDAAGRGLDVVLVEKDDLAQHTSSASTKLIHGGLRYLEMYDFALVRKALIEREILLRAAPHIIWPMRFVLPYDKDLRPAWLIRLGLFLYDHLGGREMLPPTRTLKRKSSNRLDPLKDEFRLAFEYSDCWVEDSRLVVLNAVDAKERGAEVLTRTACTRLTRHPAHWEAEFTSGGKTATRQFRAVVNSAGGWVDEVLGLAGAGEKERHLRLVKGSHIIVPKWHEGRHAYFFQNGDGRIMFAIPYERGEFT
ncbi:MAG: glycerol-3-phosphate dehydrogenase [Hyphomonas sp.]